jgi:hypothetical protein
LIHAILDQQQRALAHLQPMANAMGQLQSLQGATSPTHQRLHAAAPRRPTGIRAQAINSSCYEASAASTSCRHPRSPNNPTNPTRPSMYLDKSTCQDTRYAHRPVAPPERRQKPIANTYPSLGFDRTPGHPRVWMPPPTRTSFAAMGLPPLTCRPTCPASAAALWHTASSMQMQMPRWAREREGGLKSKAPGQWVADESQHPAWAVPDAAEGVPWPRHQRTHGH